MLLAHGPDLQEDNGVFLSGVDFPLPQWTSNRLSPCASLFIRERAPQHHALTSYWPELGHRAIFKSQGRLEKTVSGVSRHFPGGQALTLARRGKGMAAGLHSS